MKTESVHVLLAEDHAIVREGLAAVLSYQGFRVVAAASDGAEAVDRYREHRPDVCLMDLRMPKMSGVEAIAAIRTIDPAAKIIVLTTYSGDEDIHRALRAGARVYLLKDATTNELTAAIMAVVQGETVVPAMVAARLVERSTNPSLTPKETETLGWIAKGKSNKEIAQELFVSEGTIKTHVNSLLEKLDASDRTEAVVIGLKRGLIHLE